MRLFGRTWGHDRRREELSVSLDGRLSAPEYAALERHLAGCEACREELDGLRAAVALLRAAAAPQTRRSFALTPAMLETAPARPWLAQPARLPAPVLTGARWATAVAATLLFSVVSYDAGQNMLVYANVGAANRNITSAAMPSAATAPETRQLNKSAPGAESAAGGMGGGIPAPQPPAAPATAPQPAAAPAAAPAAPVQQTAPAPQAAPAPRSAPPPPPPTAADSAANAASGASEAARSSVAPLAAGPGTNDSFANPAIGAIHPQPQPAPAFGMDAPLIRWLQLALFSILTSSGFLWWWGRRPA